MIVRGVACGAVVFLAAAALSFACGSSKSDDSNGPPGGASSSSGSASGGPGSNRGPGLDLPLLLPVLKAVAPKDFGGTGNALNGQSWSGGLSPATLNSGDVKDRFFSAGPTDIFGIVAGVDSRVGDINGFSENRPRSNCFEQAPVKETLTPWGQSVDFYFQCFSKDANNPNFYEFGVKDGKVYLYMNIGAGAVSAIVTPHPGGLPDGGVALEMNVWLQVGRAVDFGKGSYGVIQIYANEQTSQFEMSVAGLGFGFCGAQLRTDAKSTYAKGSPDMGMTCQPADDVCGDNNNMMMPGVCDNLKTFSLPALGRLATTAGEAGVQGASNYPGGSLNIVKLDGTDTDSTHFGPTAPTAGVGDMSNVPPPQGPGPGDAGPNG